MAQTGEITLNKIPELLKKIDLISNDDFEQLKSLIYEALKASIEGKAKPSDKQLPYLDSLVDSYIQSPSERVLKILLSLPIPLNEHLFTILLNKITCNNNNVKNRQSVLILISKIVHMTPVWLSQTITQNRLNHFFAILKNDEEVITLGTSALIIVEMIATLPSVMSHSFVDIFNFFSRLAEFVLKSHQTNDASFLHLNAILYRFVFRLYAMYPCNFVSFLQDQYGLGCNRKNSEIFKKIIEPMLNNFRLHPLLISSSKEKECDKTRWFYKEPHDHVDDCLRYAIDPIEYFSEANELCNEENYSDDADDDEELCKLTNSTPDEDKLTPVSTVSREKQLSSETSTSNVENDSNRNAIFKQLNENITNDWRNVTLLDNSDSQPEIGTAVKASAEYAEEAISLSKKAPLKNGTVESAQNISSMRSTSRPVLAPVANYPVSKTPSLGALQRRNINKQVCVSPFKPIRENDGYDIKSLNSKSPANFHSNLSHSLGTTTSTIASGTTTTISATEDTEEVDLEIMQFSYNRENKQTEFIKNNSITPLQTEAKKKVDPVICIPFDSDTGEHVISSNNKQFDELVGNIKNSFKKANSRIRYQSHCLPETEKEHSDNYISHESPSGLSSTTRLLSKSCPILYFSDVQEKRLSIDENIKTSQFSSNSVAAAQNLYQTTDGKTATGKTKVNVENPNANIKRSMSLKHPCKSVDHTKEAQRHFQSRHESYSQLGNKYPSIDSKCRSDLYDSSIDIPRKTDPMHWKYTPLEMLDKMLLLNFYLNVTKSDQSDAGSQRVKNSRDSALNNTSSTCSMEQIFSANSCHAQSSTEESLRKQLEFMTLHLMFERHQRDLVVIRNRRLYKNLKESIKLEEQLRVSKKRIDQMESEQSMLEKNLKEKLYDYINYRKTMKNLLSKTEDELIEFKGKCQQLEMAISQMEKRYTEEIKSLQENYRMIDTDLKKYRTSFEGKNADLVKLSDENSDLKRRLFVYCEFYNKLRDSYIQNRNVTTDLNDKLCTDALKHDNSVMKNQISELTRQLYVCKDRCTHLETRLNQQEAQTKMRMESQDTQYFKDLLKSKEMRIKSLETTVINFEKHLHALNGQINER